MHHRDWIQKALRKGYSMHTSIFPMSTERNLTFAECWLSLWVELLYIQIRILKKRKTIYSVWGMMCLRTRRPICPRCSAEQFVLKGQLYASANVSMTVKTGGCLRKRRMTKHTSTCSYETEMDISQHCLRANIGLCSYLSFGISLLACTSILPW